MLLETLIIFLLFVKFDPRPQPRLHFGLLSVTIVDWILICSINTSYYITTFATMILDVQIMLLEGAGVVDWLYSHLCSSTIIVIVDFLSNSQTNKKDTFIQSLLLHSMLQNPSNYLICYFSLQCTFFHNLLLLEGLIFGIPSLLLMLFDVLWLGQAVLCCYLRDKVSGLYVTLMAETNSIRSSPLNSVSLSL